MGAAEAFWRRVDKSAKCWLWIGSTTSGGYGNLRVNGCNDYAHRVSYRLAFGSIPAGLEIDHLCRNRRCVNPEHLEPVPHAENVRRGLAPYGLRTTCRHGHDITNPENVYTSPRGDRRCRRCAELAGAERRNPSWPPTHCPHGHEYTELNTRRDKQGHRKCRECNRVRSAVNYANRKAAE